MRARAWKIILAALLLAHSSAARAELVVPGEESVRIANPELRSEWVDSKGEVQGDFEAILDTRWVRLERGSAKAGGGPSAALGIQVRVLVPREEWSEFTFQPQAGVALSEDSSIPEKFGSINPKTERLIALEADTPEKRISFRRTNSKGESSEVSLRISLDSDEPVFWVDSSCQELGVSVRAETGSGDPARGLVAGAVCEKEGKDTRLWVAHSPEARVSARNWEKASGSGAAWASYLMRVPGPGETPFQLELSREGRIVAQWSVGKDARESDASPWVLGLSGGVSSIGYRENISSEIRISELVATARGSAYYWLAPGKADLGVNGFFNLLPIGTGTGTYPSTRFYGLNFRAGYYPSFSWAGLHFGVMGGWYVWGNITSESAYGLRSLGGPQLMVSARTTGFGGRPVFGYLRVAPIFGQSGDRINLSNRELSFGGGLQLSSAERGRAWSVTLDVSQIQYENPAHFGTAGASLELFSVGAALGVTFF